jgi:hypothetical protein
MFAAISRTAVSRSAMPAASAVEVALSAKARYPPARLHEYSYGSHTAIGNCPPITRLTNLSGQYS